MHVLLAHPSGDRLPVPLTGGTHPCSAWGPFCLWTFSKYLSMNKEQVLWEAGEGAELSDS